MIVCGWCEMSFNRINPSTKYCSTGCAIASKKYSARLRRHKKGKPFDVGDAERVKSAYFKFFPEMEDVFMKYQRGQFTEVKNIIDEVMSEEDKKRQYTDIVRVTAERDSLKSVLEFLLRIACDRKNE